MSFALAPLVAILRHLKLGHVPAVVLSLALALVILSAVGTFVGSQFAGLVAELPRYQTNISHKIQSIRGQHRPRHLGPSQPDHRKSRRAGDRRSRPAEPACIGRAGRKARAGRDTPPDHRALGIGADRAGPAARTSRNPGTGAGVRRLHPAAEGRSARSLRAAGWVEATCSGPPWRWTKRRHGFRAIWSLQTIINGSFGFIIGAGLWLDRHSRCRPVGPDRHDVPLRALCRRANRLSFPRSPGAGGGSGLVHADLGGGVVRRCRSGDRPDGRALCLWPQHGSVGCGRGGGGGILDLGVGADGAAAFHAAHHVRGGSWPPCRKPEIPGCDAGRFARAQGRGKPLSAHDCGKPRGSRRGRRGISCAATAWSAITTKSRRAP